MTTVSKRFAKRSNRPRRHLHLNPTRRMVIMMVMALAEPVMPVLTMIILTLINPTIAGLVSRSSLAMVEHSGATRGRG